MSFNPRNPNQLATKRNNRASITLMELLVGVAILIVLGAVAFPLAMQIANKKHRIEAVKRMTDLGTAFNRYSTEHDGLIVAEDVSGKDDWAIMTTPEAQSAWYNALPKTLGQKTAGDFVRDGAIDKFYSLENPFYIPAAQYPGTKRKAEPVFAVAMNSRLHRKDKNAETKPETKMSQIPFPARTVALFEKGVPGEGRAHPTISKKDYDGNCKGTGKAFVTRYRGVGLITFIDGHVEEKSATDLLTETGDLVWDPANSILWSPDPAENPE